MSTMALMTRNGRVVEFKRESACDEHYATTRTAIRKALARAKRRENGRAEDVLPLRVRPTSPRYKTDYTQRLAVTVEVFENGCLALGCCIFSPTNAKLIRRWANRRAK